jgi:hypothetical protein
VGVCIRCLLSSPIVCRSKGEGLDASGEAVLGVLGYLVDESSRVQVRIPRSSRLKTFKIPRHPSCLLILYQLVNTLQQDTCP